MTEANVRDIHLFALRIWEQAIENGRTEWRGRVQYVPTGEVHYFREWSDMTAIVQQMLPAPVDLPKAQGSSLDSE
jgi:hypothetical protein